MRILLIGNYAYLKSQSMGRFASVLYRELTSLGHDVRLITPPPFLGRMLPSSTGLGKWLGYLDRFLLFLPFLKREIRWADIVHICDHANAVYVPWLKGKPHVVTCHDMLAVRSAIGEFSAHKTGPTGRIYQHWILSELKKSQHVACVSETTRDDLLRLTGIESNKISVVRNGLNCRYRPMSENQFLKHLRQIGVGDIRPFFLHVGNNNWYKNRVGLLRIFAYMTRDKNRKGWYLVIAGTRLPRNLWAMAIKLGLTARIREAPNVTNEQLRALYSACEGLIFPSLAEGFGWPIIEAQACGCPVFTSNRRPMTEVGAGGAVYFDPSDESGAAEIIMQALSRKDVWKKRGLKNAGMHSTDSMISVYLATYQRVLH